MIFWYLYIVIVDSMCTNIESIVIIMHVGRLFLMLWFILLSETLETRLKTMLHMGEKLSKNVDENLFF